jgi:hypothetical protein
LLGYSAATLDDLQCPRIDVRGTKYRSEIDSAVHKETAIFRCDETEQNRLGDVLKRNADAILLENRREQASVVGEQSRCLGNTRYVC